MRIAPKEILKRLGTGETIEQVCTAAQMSRTQFDAWWQTESRARVPDVNGSRRAAIKRPVRIERDALGIPHIYADNDEDLYFGFGYAQAQDRLFQLDYFRRRGSGRLAEILGATGNELEQMRRVVGFRSILELDLLARTVGLRRIAEAEWTKLNADVRSLLAAFSNGVNAVIEECRDRLPIEFDLLEYQPEPWSPIDCLTIEAEFAWYLTGRFPVIVIPELVRRALGDGPLYRAFLRSEADDESIMPPGSYPPKPRGVEPIGSAVSEPQSGEGSNNWVLAGSRTVTGRPLVASDPHIAFDAISWWHVVHLCGGSFNVVGAAYAGIPGIILGRNERVAWGITNNICSQRDLYQEKTDPAHPNSFLYDGRWEPARQREELIRVKGGEPVRKTIRYSRNGPIVDDVLPPPARQTGPVALKWLGAFHGGWSTALIGMARAGSAEAFREALRPWYVPTFSLVFADADGAIGYHASGRIPMRNVSDRGYRPGWDPAHQWQGLIPFEGMPQLADPPRGFVVTANNRPAPDDFPYPLSGTWGEGWRATRIRQLIEAQPALSVEDCGRMHQDALSCRAAFCMPGLLAALRNSSEPDVRAAVRLLEAWDYRVVQDSAAATIYEVFWERWYRAVIQERFEGDTAALLSGGAVALSAPLLRGDDPAGWFAPGRREQLIRDTMRSALDWLTTRLGPDPNQWQWGKLHILNLRHLLSGRGDLGRLLDQAVNAPVQGDMAVICNTGMGPDYAAGFGATFRLIADLSASPPGLWAVDSQSESGHPGSPHYRDQFTTWHAGRYHYLSLDRQETARSATSKLVLEPAP